VQLKKKLSVVHSHVEGLLEHGGIKLSAVVSDLFGVSGWAMLEHIAQGVTDVEVLAEQARGALRKKLAELKEALAGQLEPVYRLALRQHMDQVRLFRRQVEEINQALAEAMQEHLAALHRLTKIRVWTCTRRRNCFPRSDPKQLRLPARNSLPPG
jgi:hypothetical protein